MHGYGFRNRTFLNKIRPKSAASALHAHRLELQTLETQEQVVRDICYFALRAARVSGTDVKGLCIWADCGGGAVGTLQGLC